MVENDRCEIRRFRGLVVFSIYTTLALYILFTSLIGASTQIQNKNLHPDPAYDASASYIRFFIRRLLLFFHTDSRILVSKWEPAYETANVHN